MADQLPVTNRSTFRRIAPAIGLFFLSPLVAEFLLGNIAIDAIWVGLISAPLYGGGAVFIREVTRRANRGWPTMMLFALAFAVFEEGLATQTLFSPTYFGFDLIGPTHIPFLGIGAWWTLYVLTLHTVWSMAVPIALVEALVPDRATEPWLGKLGLTVFGLLFLLGGAIIFFGTYAQEKFVAAPSQLIGTVVVILLLVMAGFRVAVPRPSAVGRPAPKAWIVGIAAFAGSGLYLIGQIFPYWATVAGWLALFAGFTWLVLGWSRRPQWGAEHRLALAGGALMTYAWQGFPHAPIVGSPGTIDLIGNTIFATGAVILLALAIRSLRRAKACAARNSP